jgi:hypothetical protein
MSERTSMAYGSISPGGKMVLVCVGFANGEAIQDYLRYRDEDDLSPPLPWKRRSRHADTPLFVLEEVEL